MGVMFIATRGGEPVEPPAAYGEDESTDRCSPWHAHTGLPGRFGWWYYRQAYEREFADGDLEFPLSNALYAPRLDRRPPRERLRTRRAPARRSRSIARRRPRIRHRRRPGEDELGWDVLPNELVPERTPNEFSLPDLFGIDLGL